MATVTAFIRTSKKKAGKTNIRFRLRDGRSVQLFHSSEIIVDPNLWDKKEQQIKARVLCNPIMRTGTNAAVAARKMLILDLYNKLPNRGAATSQWLDKAIDRHLHPQEETCLQTLFDVFDEFLDRYQISDVRKKNYRVVKRALIRYELFKCKESAYELSFNSLTGDTLLDIEDFLKNEYRYVCLHPDIYSENERSKNRISRPRGQNTINGMLIKLRTFLLWSIREGKMTTNPFHHYKINESIYGTPYYISIEERNELYSYNLSGPLAVQRDIFVFQCLIGCRVGDLMKLTKGSVMDNAVEYIPRKTKDGRPATVRVPLTDTAQEILQRYADCGEKLLPFICEQKYNKAIKEIFKLAGLTRMVTVLNPTTRQEQKRPLNEIASSHLARRCFIGNLYKQVKDPNLVGSLSGHKEGSKAFARYRDIDDDIKTELIDMLK